MYVIKDIGTFTELPLIALHIYHNHITALEQFLEQGWDIEEPLTLSPHINLTPLQLAIILGQEDVIHLLVEHGVNLNSKEKPAFLLAVRYGEEALIRYLVDHGAHINGLNKVKSSAYDAAYFGNKHNMALIYELGLDIQKYGGSVLRKAVFDRDRSTVDFLLDHGVDINHNKSDMVYPYQATPLTIATRKQDVEMVKYLIGRGADITIAESNGERPYTIALIEKNQELVELLKGLEPADFHNQSNKLYALQSYKLPKAMMDFLGGADRILQWTGSDNQEYHIECLHLMDTVEMKVGRQRYLRISAEVSYYSDLLIVWNPSKKVIGCYDEEHQTYTALGKWVDFVADPKAYMEIVLA